MILAVPLGVQALLMFVDEFVFHRRRGLPKWEKWGHPLDTLSVVAAVAVPTFAEPTQGWLTFYLALALVSCLLVTKDEWVHASRCAPMEHWLHALLFVFHPIVFGCLGWAWWEGFQKLPRLVLLAEMGALVGFGFYQVLYWMRK